MSDTIRARLLALRDEPYGDFIARLIPTMARERIIGVRTPALRALAKELRGTPQAEGLLRSLPHHFYEEDQLHAALIAQEKDFDRALLLTEAFLPHIDNWATCDSFSPPVFGKHPEDMLKRARAWLKSPLVYTQRYAIGVLMRWFLDEYFDPAHLALVASHASEEYYVHMMRAWYFATALTKQWEAALPYIEQRRMDRRTHLKSIQKAVESRLISDERKARLRSLRY